MTSSYTKTTRTHTPLDTTVFDFMERVCVIARGLSVKHTFLCAWYSIRNARESLALKYNYNFETQSHLIK